MGTFEHMAILNNFLTAIRKDPRVSPAHISVFLSILHFYDGQGGLSVFIRRDQVTIQAKISSSTYHRCMNQLHEYGYIRYQPSFDPQKSCKVDINKL